MNNYLRQLQLRRPWPVMLKPDGGGAGGAAGGDPSAAGGAAGGDPSGAGGAAGDEAAKPLTAADVTAIVTAALAAEKKAAEKAAKKTKTEADKLAGLTEEQRAAAEEQARLAALDEREAEITRRELHATAVVELGKKGLDTSLADLLNYTDAEACTASLATLEKAFRAAVEKTVKERLGGKELPKAGGGGTEAAHMAAIRAAAGLPIGKD